MGISIKNDRVEALIREMAEKAGLPLTEAVGVAVERWLDDAETRNRRSAEAKRREIDAALKRLRARHVVDDWDPTVSVDDLLYDESGLPK